MQILFLCPLFYPHIGGVEKHSFEIGKKLVKKGNKVVIITENYSPSILKSVDNIDGIKIYRFNFGKNNWIKKFRIWFILWKHKKLIEKSDIIHCHDVFFWYLPFRFIYFKKNVFTTFHGFETKFPISRKAILIRKISEILSFGNICVGDYIKKWYRTCPSFVIYGGMERIKNLKFKNKNKQSLRSGDLKKNFKIRILLIGRLEDDIGIEIYLKTLEILKKRNVNFELNVLGDGVFRKEVEKFGNVFGFNKNVNEYILKSDIIFASSYLSIIQAMACKKPVFSVYNNSLKEDYLKMTPFANWIDIDNDPVLLVNKIISLNKESENIKIKLAYNWVKNQTWDKVLNTYFKLWGTQTI